IWVTDGTPGGTRTLHDFESTAMPSGFTTPVLFKGLLYFAYNDSTTSALWTTDGTPANTRLLKNLDVNPDNAGFGGFGLLSSVVINSKLFFSAYSRAAGNEMWSTDGTAAGTALFKDINPGPEGSDAFFVFNTGAYAGTGFTGNGNFSYQQFYTPYKGKYYFTANDGAHGAELWATDGTAANTTLVKDINPGSESGLSDGFASGYYTSTGIFFAADDGALGEEPWVTDGTDASTKLVADINKNNPDGSDFTYLFIYNNQLYLDASSGGQNSSLYKINGATGTLPLRLLSFSAQKQPQSVLLNWVTTNEVNVGSFSIERSIEGSHFSGIGTQLAIPVNEASKNYQYNDISALQAGSSTLYYRLKITDKDGKSIYSPVLMVQLENGVFTVKLSPNPVRDQLTVSFSAGASARATLRVIDVNGRQLFQQVYAGAPSAAMQQNIDVSRYAKGIYFVQLVTGSGTKSLQFVKE
ncbi:MAG: T9SS type A sorting domain-containing protein, partial [Williamsia sp.]|nr:T9SS type A sorting domain-containing protein [Williamsia sp.]